MIEALRRFKEIHFVDCEFGLPVDGRPAVRCLVVIEWRSGRCRRFWVDELATMAQPPFDIGPDSLVVAYSATAELSCFLSMCWPLPANILDLHVEFRNATNGLTHESSLAFALTWFGQANLDVRLKELMRSLALRGGEYTNAEKNQLMAYCEGDVRALLQLGPHVVTPESIDMALVRGRFVRAAAVITDHGIPIDVGQLRRIQDGRERVCLRMAADPERNLGLYEGSTFKLDRFVRMIDDAGIYWPRHESGQPDISAETFDEMSRMYPDLRPLSELRKTMSLLRRFDLQVGPDGRLHPGANPFWTTTGRNQARAAEHILPHPKFLRGVVGAGPGQALAYLDWGQQEIGIGAALSGDAVMMAAYQDADCHIAFGKEAGILPPNATADTHPKERKGLKACGLGVLFGKTGVALARDLGITNDAGADLIAMHRRTFPGFWRWLEAAVNYAMFHRAIRTVFGWQLHLPRVVNPRSVMNFPLQATGAEMMRLAVIYAVEAGVKVIGIFHDGLLIEAPAAGIADAAHRMHDAMDRASSETLAGFILKVDTKIMPHPETFLDPKDRATWDLIQRALDEIDREREVP